MGEARWLGSAQSPCGVLLCRMLRVVKSRAASKRAAAPKKTKPSRRACECVLLARGGSRARSSHATTHPNNHQLHIVLNELRTDEHGKVIVSAL